jgi:hypothetical protein
LLTHPVDGRDLRRGQQFVVASRRLGSAIHDRVGGQNASRDGERAEVCVRPAIELVERTMRFSRKTSSSR